jgi:MFS family permease
VTFVADLRTLLRLQGFRRLFAVRLTSQSADGIFQVALASSVLFSPERAPDATAIALGFTALLLPFSVLGPFVGVFLDRWPRRSTLMMSNLVRVGLLVVVAAFIAADALDGRAGLAFFLVVLACFSVNRFLLAGLSAALPRVVPDDELVMANAVSPTCGTLAFIVGAGVGGLVHALAGDVAVVAVAAVVYLLASGVASRLPFLGPDATELAAHTVLAGLRVVTRGLIAGLRHIPRPAALALGAIGASRFFYGLTTVATVLLYRNYFGDPDSGGSLGGLGLIVGASGLGYGIAAVITPIATRRMRPQTWQVVLLCAAGVLQLFPAGLYTQPALVVAAAGLGIASQGVKICTDAIVQTHVTDRFRGRVFSLYDVLFNVVFVSAAAVAALVLPDDGKSYPVLAVCALGYLATALIYRRLDEAEVSPAAAGTPRREGPGPLSDPAGR